MIRVTRSGFLDRMNAGLGRISAAKANAEEQALTGLRVNRPSDAPGSVREAARLHAAAADQEVWQSNASSATGVLSALDNALSDATNTLVRAQEIALAGANEPLGAEARVTMALEVQSLMESLRASMNTEFGGRYVFAGTAWDAPPFDATDVFVGNSDPPQVRIGTDQWVQTGLDGSAVFQGPVDILATLGALSAALSTDDAAGVSATIADLETASRTVINARSEAGTYAASAEAASDVAASMGQVLVTRLTDILVADPAEAYTRLTELRNSYTAALQVTGSSTTRTLFDYLA